MLQNTADYTSQLIEPVLTCFSDPDSRVRYYACEVETLFYQSVVRFKKMHVKEAIFLSYEVISQKS